MLKWKRFGKGTGSYIARNGSDTYRVTRLAGQNWVALRNGSPLGTRPGAAQAKKLAALCI